MQDGSYQKGQGIYIAICSYTNEDASSLFSIMVSINSKFDKIGKIYVYEHGQESTLSFSSLDSIRFLIEIFFFKRSFIN